MKNLGTYALFTFLILLSCGQKENSEKGNRFNIDLSGLSIDLSKPQIQSYDSETQRDSLLNVITDELEALDLSPAGATASKTGLFLISVSQEKSTLTAQILEAEKVDYGNWEEIAICPNSTCLNAKMKEIVIRNPTVEFLIKKDLSVKESILFYKKG